MSTPEREALAAAEIGLANLISYQYSVHAAPKREYDSARHALDAVRAALAASPAAGGVQALTDEQIDDCMPLGMHAHSVLCGPDEIRRFARRIETRATPPAAPAQAIRYDGLHEYAEKHRLDYNELCCVARTALASQEGAAK